jgi:ubiquinone/menaquinone biosynthesis C-methylase UbiE
MSVEDPRTRERDYVLGTHDEEIARLGLQHRVWRPHAAAAWARAGFTVGQTLLDFGCGPGYAALDLAEIVGPTGRVVAIDRSRRFLDALEATARQRGLAQLEALELDLDAAPLPALAANGAWGRWVLAFLQQPRELLERVQDALAPGATLALHEYLDYSTWRMAPRCPELETFVERVTESWRASGGEPDVGLDLPRWLTELGFEIRYLEPIAQIASPADFTWHWSWAFIEVGLERLVALGSLSRAEASAIAEGIARSAAAPHTWMVMPTVLEVVAAKR